MAINLYTSNRLETLANVCTDIFRQDPLTPFEAEIVVAQSRGMARWLAMQFASRLSVWANGSFPFPNAFVGEIFRQVLGQSDQPVYERKKGLWQLMQLLDEVAEEPFMAGICQKSADSRKRFQLAGQLADLFDQYSMYRPDLILSWEDGQDGSWQAELWRRLVARFGLTHRAALLDRFRHALNSECPPLLRRITLFGISSLPPFHLEVFDALSRHTSVHLFFMNPSRHWWGDIISEKEISRRLAHVKKDADELYLESGNSLLASMGHIARDFLSFLQEKNCREFEFFENPPDNTLLAIVQQDILELVEAKEKRPPDNSIVVNSCHSAMREVEVLHDHLLRLFEEDPSLKPEDIIVMAPDIEPYSPLVQAVFGPERDRPRFIPYSLADRSIGSSCRLIDAFFSLLDQIGGRYEASRILDLVQLPVVSRRFSLGEADCLRIREWVEELSIRWGRDVENKKELGLPPFGENTWRAGLDRLLLGYAMSGQNEIFSGILPFDVEGGDSEILGRMLDCLQALFFRMTNLQAKRTLSAWSLDLLSLVEECFLPEEGQENEAQQLRNALQELAVMQEKSGFDGLIDLPVMNGYLQKVLGEEKSPHGFLSGGVTFCSLLPMRAIPFKVVCLLGMNDVAFPRPHFSLNFDLMDRHPRPGDRSPRLDDRYLFLEALLSARRQFYISYQGQSVQDDTSLPPSVLVSELLDFLQQDDSFISRHRLQPFHPDYFRRESPLFSYSQENFRACRRLVKGVDSGVGFWQGLPINEADESFRHVDLHDLLDFFVHPLRFFCRKRLGVDLQEGDEQKEDMEPFRIEGLARYQLEAEMVKRAIGQEESGNTAALWRARGMLPHGPVGDIAGKELLEEVDLFQGRLEPYLSPLKEPLVFQIKINEFQVSGRMENRTENGLLFARPAAIKGRDLLRAWLQHLIMNMVDTDCSRSSFVVGKKEAIVLQPIENGGEILGDLLDLYWQGLREPLPFFSETSYRYADFFLQGKHEEADKAAHEYWYGGYNRLGECEDVYMKFRFRSSDTPLDASFEKLALRVFGPLFNHLEEEGD